jgi:hypothetical protein
MEIVDTLGFLVGNWAVRRSITDHHGEAQGLFEGTATWTETPCFSDRVPCWASYREAGDLQIGAHRVHATRRLVGARLESAMMLYFADGRPYLDLDLRNGHWQAKHPCGDDTYDIVTLVHSYLTMEERWRVRGPAQDYSAVTFFTRF